MNNCVVALLALCALTGCSSGSGVEDASGTQHALIGKQAPDIDAEKVMGDGPTSPSDARGTVTIVDFWATYCDPCRKSFPAYQQMVDEGDGNLVVIGVSVDDPDDVSVDDVKAWVNELSVKFPIVWDKEKKTAPVYNPPKMPTSYIIDKEGVVRYVFAGYQAGAEEEMKAKVAELNK